MIEYKLPINAELFIGDEYISFYYKFKNMSFSYYNNNSFVVFQIIDDHENIPIVIRKIDNIFSFMKILKHCITYNINDEFRYKYSGNKCICMIKIVDKERNKIKFNYDNDDICIINYLYINKNDKNRFIEIINSIISILNISFLKKYK